MYAFNSLMIGIDLTTDNNTLISYAYRISQLFDSDKIFFVHVTKDLNEEKDYYSGDQPYDEYLKEQVRDQIRSHFSVDKVSLEINILEGEVEEQLIHWAEVKKADLLIVGDPTVAEYEQVLPYHLARLAPCSTLVVPEEVEDRLEKLMIPVDNSPYTQMSLEIADQLRNKKPELDLLLYHSLRPPSTFLSATTERYEKFVEQLRQEARKEMQEIVETVEGEDKMQLLIEPCRGHIADCIFEKAEEEEADMMIIGSKGRTNTAAVFMGSITERILNNDPSMPVLVLRKKGEHRNLIQEIFYSKSVKDINS